MVAPTICKAVREQWREKPPLHKGAFCLCKHCEVHGENSFPTIFLKKGLQFAKRCAIITPAFKRGGVAQLVEYWSPKPRVVGSNPPAPAMLCGQNRSARGKQPFGKPNGGKREISRDFSRFFDPAFFRSFIDPFCPFRCCVRIRTHEKGFFASSREQSVLWLDSDLRKRKICLLSVC